MSQNASRTRKSLPPPAISELEGAILGEIARAERATAYAVRKEFATSPSNMVSASKGAIYPAIARLVAAGLVEATDVAGDGRGAQTLALTPAGERALHAWVTDAYAAVGAGLDPFRCRSGHWAFLPLAEETALRRRLREALVARLSFLEAHLERVRGQPDEVRVGLEMRLQQSRLDFLAEDQRKRS